MRRTASNTSDPRSPLAVGEAPPRHTELLVPEPSRVTERRGVTLSSLEVEDTDVGNDYSTHLHFAPSGSSTRHDHRRTAATDFTNTEKYDAQGSVWANPEDVGLVWRQVLKEERQSISLTNSERHLDGRRERPFSVAFSGGGVRAAAFQAGVLWRLAEVGALQDVEYLAAVSGGGYLASAFASHCLHTTSPERGNVKAWYLDVVARTIIRMQRNAGNFVRDTFEHAGRPEDGAGWCPRFMDLPILLVMLLITMSMNPFMFLVAFLVPFSSGMKVVFGAGMRAAFCAQDVHWITVLRSWSHIDRLGWICVGLVSITFLVAAIRKILPSCKLRKGHDGIYRAGSGYLMGHATNAFLVRFTVVCLFLYAFIFAMVWVQLSLYNNTERGSLLKAENCAAFIKGRNLTDIPTCSDMRWGKFWYNADMFRKLGQEVDATMQLTGPSILEQAHSQLQKERHVGSIMTFVCLGLMGVISAGIIFAPILGPTLTIMVLHVVGPFVLAVFMLRFVQIAIFGPITEHHPGIRVTPWGAKYEWNRWEDVSFGVSLVMVPLYPWLRSSMHKFYMKCLQKNFFHDGLDCSFSQILQNPYCPFLILTGTCSDYQPPGDADLISEIYFSSLHCGGDETGYLRMPKHRSLAKCTALTGAGCLDAISLTMADAMALRFWLEVLNLTWGDYIIFERYPLQVIKELSKSAGRFAATADRFLHFLPSGLIWLTFYILLNFANFIGKFTVQTSHTCGAQKILFSIAGIMLGLMLLLSFIPQLPFHALLASDPLLREIHQATKYYYVGDRPPRMLYVTDGGVKDCTAVLQLMRRRCRRILLILAAADANDDLKVLKTMMKTAVDEKIGSFFNPDDPQECIDILFEKFKRSRDIPYLHFGICYSWDSIELGDRTADLYIVKNRLPSDFEAQPIRPLLTVEEIKRERVFTKEDAAFIPEEWEGITTDSLGSFGCCDCCHRRGYNCGPKFPHGSFAGYMYLSPQWFNSLVRLGFEVSAPVVEEVTGKRMEEDLPPDIGVSSWASLNKETSKASLGRTVQW